MIIPITTQYTGLRYEDEATAYFNKLDTPISEAAKIKINDLIKTMKTLDIWNNCVHGWLFVPEYSGVPNGATTGTFYDLKGVMDLNMSGFELAGQTQTTKGPHVFCNAARTRYSVLSGTMPTAGVFGDTNYGLGEDIGTMIGLYIDEPLLWGSDTGAIESVRPGLSFAIQQSGSYPIAAGNGQIFDISTAGSGTSISFTPQYISRGYEGQFPTTRGMRSGFIGNAIVFERPLVYVNDPTSTFEYWNTTFNNLAGNTSHSNLVSAYSYGVHSSISRASSAAVMPTVENFFNRTTNTIHEQGTVSSYFAIYERVNTNVANFPFLLNVAVPSSITSRVFIICTDKPGALSQNTNGGYPLFTFIFSKKTNFGFRSPDRLIELNLLLKKMCSSHLLPCIGVTGDRSRMRFARNLNDTSVPPMFYLGLSGINGSNMVSLYNNFSVSANAGTLSTFNLEVFCENKDYSSLPTTVTNMTSTTFISFLESFEIHLHNGRNFAPTSLVYPLCAFTLGSGETVNLNIAGFLTKTYRKLCSATVAPSAAGIVRSYNTQYATVSNFNVVVADFSLSYVP